MSLVGYGSPLGCYKADRVILEIRVEYFQVICREGVFCVRFGYQSTNVLITLEVDIRASR